MHLQLPASFLDSFLFLPPSLTPFCPKLQKVFKAALGSPCPAPQLPCSFSFTEVQSPLLLQQAEMSLHYQISPRGKTTFLSNLDESHAL